MNDVGDGYQQIINARSGKCLNVAAADTANGADVLLWECVGVAHEQWRLERSPDGRGFSFRARHSDKCLDVSGVSRDRGGRLNQWDCAGVPQQQFGMSVEPAPGGPTLPEPGPDENPLTTLRPVHSGKCLVATGQGLGRDQSATDQGIELVEYNGMAVAQSDCTEGEDTYWWLNPIGDGFYQVISSVSGLCLNVAGAATSNGAAVVQWECSDAPNEQWRFEPSSDNRGYSLRARHSDRCLDVPSADTRSGIGLIQWDCADVAHHHFAILGGLPTEGIVYTMAEDTPMVAEISAGAGKGFVETTLRAQHSGKCLHVENENPDRGARVVQWDCNGSPGENWVIEPNYSDGYARIIDMLSGQCLNVSGGASWNGATVIKWDCVDSENEQWLPELVADGSGYRFRARHSNKCLNVAGADVNNGAHLIQWDCGESPNAIFGTASSIPVEELFAGPLAIQTGLRLAQATPGMPTYAVVKTLAINPSAPRPTGRVGCQHTMYVDKPVRREREIAMRFAASARGLSYADIGSDYRVTGRNTTCILEGGTSSGRRVLISGEARGIIGTLAGVAIGGALAVVATGVLVSLGAPPPVAGLAGGCIGGVVGSLAGGAIAGVRQTARVVILEAIGGCIVAGLIKGFDKLEIASVIWKEIAEYLQIGWSRTTQFAGAVISGASRLFAWLGAFARSTVANVRAAAGAVRDVATAPFNSTEAARRFAAVISMARLS